MGVTIRHAPPSDYGRAFHSLASSRVTGSRDEILVVLGDGRVNRFDPQDWAFEELARRSRCVLWLAPERRELWGTGDSVLPDYLRHCDTAVEASDLGGLADGVREILRAL